MNEVTKHNFEVLYWMAQSSSNIAKIISGSKYRICGGILEFYRSAFEKWETSTSLDDFLKGKDKLTKDDGFVSVDFGTFIGWYQKNQELAKPYRCNDKQLASVAPLINFLNCRKACSPDNQYQIPQES